MSTSVEGNLIVGRERCPRCAQRGKDTSGDNLAIYQDGHEWCYACQYYVPAPSLERVRNLTNDEKYDKKPGALAIPDDATFDVPYDVGSMLAAWGISHALQKEHNIQWSPSEKVLIYPVYDDNMELIFYQTRSFDPSGKKKYLTYGDTGDILHILYPRSGLDRSCIILTEDLISAIRVSHYKSAMPIWGSNIPLKTIKRLAARFYTVGVWLDPDMQLKAVKDVLRISQYVPAFFVDSTRDPKWYSDDSIKEHIDIAGYGLVFQDRPANVIDHSGAQ